MTLFGGLSVFPLTPLDEAGNVDAAVLGRFIERIVVAGVDSIGLLGSTDSLMLRAGVEDDDGAATGRQTSLFYEFSLERHAPASHFLRSIDRFVGLPNLRRV